ncbi:MAG TPA: hypothetical protein VM142_00025 [Acidimicrobiales bacterium]|nr:hypothetical protein [Acidimicrobiales bacterium]
MSATAVPPLRGIVCGDNAAVPRLLYLSGFSVLAELKFAAQAVALVERERPDVVVVDVAACGTLGLGVISLFTEASPQSAVIVLSPFENLRAAALAAGASEMVDNNDLRPLLACFERIRRAAHGGIACPCCAGGTTAIAFDPPGSRITVSGPDGGSAAALGL